MHKTIIALLILLACLVSCVQQSEEATWPHDLYWYSLRGTHQEVYYLPLKISHTDDTSFIYQTPFDTSSYAISPEHLKQAKLLSQSYTDSLFYFVKKHTITVNGKEFIVYQYSTADGTIDAGTEHYWNEQLGVFFIRSTTWSIYRVLQFDDEEKNKEIWMIVKKLYPRIEESLKLAREQEGMEHIRKAHHTVVDWNWKE